MESLYKDKRPPHHHSSARDPIFNVDDPPASSIFVAEYSSILGMQDTEIQDIFRHRHILVVGAPLKKMDFSLKTLSAFWNVDKKIDILGESL